MKIFRKRIQKGGYSNMTEPVGDLDPARMNAIKKAGGLSKSHVGDLDPAVIAAIKSQHAQKSAAHNASVDSKGANPNVLTAGLGAHVKTSPQTISPYGSGRKQMSFNSDGDLAEGSSVSSRTMTLSIDRSSNNGSFSSPDGSSPKTDISPTTVVANIASKSSFKTSIKRQLFRGGKEKSKSMENDIPSPLRQGKPPLANANRDKAMISTSPTPPLPKSPDTFFQGRNRKRLVDMELDDARTSDGIVSDMEDHELTHQDRGSSGSHDKDDDDEQDEGDRGFEYGYGEGYDHAYDENGFPVQPQLQEHSPPQVPTLTIPDNGPKAAKTKSKKSSLMNKISGRSKKINAATNNSSPLEDIINHSSIGKSSNQADSHVQFEHMKHQPSSSNKKHLHQHGASGTHTNSGKSGKHHNHPPPQLPHGKGKGKVKGKILQMGGGRSKGGRKHQHNASNQNHNNDAIHDNDISSSSSDLDRTFDPEIISVNSNITDPTFYNNNSSDYHQRSSSGGSGGKNSQTWEKWQMVKEGLAESCRQQISGGNGRRFDSSSPSGGAGQGTILDTILDTLCANVDVDSPARNSR